MLIYRGNNALTGGINMRSAFFATFVMVCLFLGAFGCKIPNVSKTGKKSLVATPIKSTPQKDQECSYSAAKSITVKGKTFRLIGTYLPAEITAEHTKNYNRGFYRKPFNSCDRGDVIAEYIETTKK